MIIGAQNQLTYIAKLALKSSAADAFSIGALSVAVAIRCLALVVFQAALFALPTWITLALAVDVIASSTTKHWTDT